MTGWRGNDLGLLKSQVLFVHDERVKMVRDVSELCMAGTEFQDAKDQVYKRERKAWKHLAPNVRTALDRCARDIRYSDLDKAVLKRDEADFIRASGREPTRLRRFLFGMTGLVW